MQSRSKSAGTSLRRVKSPDAPKITRMHDSLLGNGAGEQRSMGKASTMALIDSSDEYL
jgi:hypothetical protein